MRAMAAPARSRAEIARYKLACENLFAHAGLTVMDGNLLHTLARPNEQSMAHTKSGMS